MNATLHSGYKFTVHWRMKNENGLPGTHVRAKAGRSLLLSRAQLDPEGAAAFRPLSSALPRKGL
jgi:hypothetical protein